MLPINAGLATSEMNDLMARPAPLINEVERELDPDEYEKPTDIAREMMQRVTLIPNGGGKVIGTIILAVVMFDMVVKVRALHP